MKTDKRIDEYIKNSQDFAKPILTHLRELVHQADQEITETIKWGMPFFEYKGTVCSMAAFKNHVTFGFWKERLMKDPEKLFKRVEKEAMGSLGRVTNMKDLPSDAVIINYIKEAVGLNEAGMKLSRNSTQKAKALKIPDYFQHALKK